MNNNITFVVCSKNSIETIDGCLSSIQDFPVILVDKDSNDGTLEIAKKFKNVKIINQKGNGLANARNIGLEKVKTEFCVMWGVDNLWYKGYPLDGIIQYMNNCNWVGCGLLTGIPYQWNYYDKCIDIWFNSKIKEGQREVVGTPILYKTNILKKFKYDENCSHSDDSNLGKRLKESGFKQGYSNYFCFDITRNNFKNILDRFLRYGISDKEYHIKYCKTLKSKIKSYLHTLTSDFVPNIYFIPFWFMIMIIRFIGRIKK
jgi:glycosyltransferase involved in cell wall biosynthesis